MSPLVELLVFALATARLTRLVTDDSITSPIRAKVLARWGNDSRIAELVHCDWCSGMWCSAAVVLLARLGGIVDSWTMAAILVPATAWLAAMLRAMIEE